MSFSQDEMNPYLSPTTANSAAKPPERTLPGFCKVVFIIELVLCSLRVPLVALGFVGASMIDADDPLAKTVFFELATGIGIVLFGIPGNIGLLMKKGWGVPLGYLLLLMAAGSLLTGVLQMMAKMSEIPAGSPEYIGAIIGGGFVFLFRLALMGLFLAALMKFSSWFKQQPR